MTPQSPANDTTASTRWTNFFASFRRGFGRLPILGPLANCTLKNHIDSLKEFSITIVFGTATFWVSAFFLKGLLVNSSKAYTDVLLTTVSSGQLFIFAVGMIGPILLASSEDADPTKQFPGRTYHLSLLVLIGVLASGYYAFVLAAKEPQVALLLDREFLFRASIGVAAIVVAMRYLTTVYRKSLSSFNAEEKLKDPVNSFADKFSARHPAQDAQTPNIPFAEAADEMTARFNSRNGDNL